MLLKPGRVFNLLISFVFATSAAGGTDVNCVFAPGLSVGNESQTMKCCNQTVSNFHLFWSEERLYLTTYLQTLRSWGCPQFEVECRERLFVVNSFTELVFDYFCNYTNVFVPRCYQTVSDVYRSARERQDPLPPPTEASGSLNDTLEENWQALVKDINTTFLTIEELTGSPCLQVALYEAEDEHTGEYVELIRFRIPSCYPMWCGIDGASLRNHMLSVWSCLSKK